MANGTEAVRELLRDSFERVHELVGSATEGLSREEARWRPDADANPVGWLVWHSARVQDDHLAGIDGEEQVWVSGGWQERMSLPFGVGDVGYGFDRDQVGQVDVEPALLAEYHEQVHARTLAYVAGVDPDELARVVDENWDPPVTAAVRLVSVLGDCLQHLGQAAYVRGLLERRG